ncbi:MAG TPA: sigma 54-interacting transcriptional regulator, partial [Bdellovibrionota bacterium]|nr:sigma 54-interacting transcriptional regulator [Bdellovibrionota bacterium]
MKWQIRIQEPSGETRKLPLQGPHVIGRGEGATIVLRDPTVPSEGLTLWPARLEGTGSASLGRSPYWIRAPKESSGVRLGDLCVRESELPAGLPVRIGETLITIEPEASDLSLPSFPSGTRPWFTRTESGRKVLWMARKAAATPLSIYLAGETGTGKEVLAHLLHAWSARAAGPFVPLHCGALPLSLAESELFGHVKGAFTGAVQSRPGALMQAHGGTLFLDEIGDLPLDIQVKLLRFLENGEIRPVGADRPSRVDVRLLCATHHPLLQLVEEGRFRRDLYYRL